MQTKLPAKTVIAVILATLLASGCARADISALTHSNANKPTPSAVATAPATLPDFSALVERVGPAVVNIRVSKMTPTAAEEQQIPDFPGNDPFFEFFRRFQPFNEPPRQEPQGALGSGFIINADGYVLTNAHVVDGAREVTVKLTDKREFKAKVIGADKRTDIALLKIDAHDLPVAKIGDPVKVRVGEWVAAIGSPFGFENSVTAGIVSAKGRWLPNENYLPFIQSDVAINPGNSGGPLFNMNGEVVGINSQIYSQTGGYMGLSFSIPIDVAMDVERQLQGHGKVTRGRIGVTIQELTPQLAKSFGIKESEGALVAQVDKDGPAERAGIRPGDVILKYDGKPVTSSNELPRLVGSTKPGSTVEIEVRRNGAARNYKVTVDKLPDERVAQAPGASANVDSLGLAVEELGPDERKELHVDHGLLVEGVTGAAEQAGIQPGDVILAVNNEKVRSVEQFNRLVDRRAPDKSVALLVQRGTNRLYVPIEIG